jgi:hypothetical protein
MSTYLLALLVTIWEWAFAPPINWLLSLSLEWQIELAILLIAVLFCGSLIERYVIGCELGGEWWAEKKQVREWYRIGSMEPRDFQALTASIRKEADRGDHLADRLASRAGAGFRGHVLRNAVWRRHQKAQALRAEADRLEHLWDTIEKERGGPNDSAAMRTKVLRLMQRLNFIDERAAMQALDELKRIGNWFDWESLAPKEMGEPQRERLGKLLRQMAGTTNLDEARNAYRTALRMLELNNWDRQWKVA